MYNSQQQVIVQTVILYVRFNNKIMEGILNVKYLIDDNTFTKSLVVDKETAEEAIQAVTDYIKNLYPTAIVYEITA